MIRTRLNDPGRVLNDKHGRPLQPGDRVSVEAGPHPGVGTVDATDDEANKAWVKFEPQGDRPYSYVFWIDIEHVSKA